MLGGCDLNDERDRDLDETHQLGILDGGGSDGWSITCSILLSAVDEHENITDPVDSQGRVMAGMLHGRQGSRE